MKGAFRTPLRCRLFGHRMVAWKTAPSHFAGRQLCIRCGTATPGRNDILLRAVQRRHD